MKRVVPAFALLALATPAQAQWTPPSEVFQLHAKGDGNWSISCTITADGGAARTESIEGPSRSWKKLHAGRAQEGSCSYRADASQALTIRVRGRFVCPLPAPEEEGCQQIFPAGSAGELAVKPRD